MKAYPVAPRLWSRLSFLRILEEEVLRAYGEHHAHVASGVAFSHDAHRLTYTVGRYRLPQHAGFHTYLHGNPYHPLVAFAEALPLRERWSVERTRSVYSGSEIPSREDVAKASSGGRTLGVTDGERRSRRPIPSPSMVHRRRRSRKINECRSMCVPTTISLESMLRVNRVAIGLSDYRSRVMVTRAIVLW